MSKKEEKTEDLVKKLNSYVYCEDDGYFRVEFCLDDIVYLSDCEDSEALEIPVEIFYRVIEQVMKDRK